MKASASQLLDCIRKAPQFEIPIYQRTYSWSEAECRQLWDDLIRAGSSDGVPAHFLGSIVYIEASIYVITDKKTLLVIDGQQRLTSIVLLLEALARALGDSMKLGDYTAARLRHHFLREKVDNEEPVFKLLLTQKDRSSLIALLEQQQPPSNLSERVVTNFGYFTNWIKELGTDLEVLFRGIQKLVIVEIALERGKDDPQLIFESLNSLGKRLSQADLIRNFILMDLEPWKQQSLFEKYWRPMERYFGEDAYSTQFDGFMRHFLTLKTGDIPNVDAVYQAFKEYARRPDVHHAGIDALVLELHDFARYYCVMALGHSVDGELDRELLGAFRDLRELRVDVAYPFLLELYYDFRSGRLTPDSFIECVRLIEAYIFRRAVCSIATNSHNRTFATLGRTINKDRYVESLKAQFLLMQSYRRFPSNEEFRRELVGRNIYAFARRSYLLRRLENLGRKEPVPVDSYSIEHIMPQNQELSAEWRTALGPEWKEVHETLLHTLGNLTLTGYNTEYSDKSFRTKRDMQGGFRSSPLWLNEDLRESPSWNAESIHLRAKRLAKRALKIWSTPVLSTTMLEIYKPKPLGASSYTYDQFEQLKSGGKTRQLYEELRHQVLLLESCVIEAVRKYYLVFKAEGNLVSVVPKQGLLLLYIDIPFHELRDDQAIAKDASGFGHWGTGDVMVQVKSADDIPYVVGLIRQALERQLGNGVSPDM